MEYGYFDDQAREYVITRPDTPRPWSNYLGSAGFGAVITNHGSGYTFYQSAAQGRLSRYRFNEIPTQNPGKYIYLRDTQSGVIWANGWLPVLTELSTFSYECRHGTGYTRIRSSYQGIVSEVLYFIPLGKTFEIWEVAIKNVSNVSRSIQVFPFLEPQCNWNVNDDTRNIQYTHYIARTAYVPGIIDIGSNVNMPEDPEHFENKDQKRHTFFAVTGLEPAGYDGDLTEFIGPYGTYAAPRSVIEGKCRNSLATGDNPCAAFQFDLQLAPGEEIQFAILFGVGEAQHQGKEVVETMHSPQTRQEAWYHLRNYWHSKLETLWARTPDPLFDSMLNTWAPYNNLMTFYWSRTASLVYTGERDGLGYRDTVQDCVGSVALIPEETRDKLTLMITGQLSSGGALPVVKPFAHHPGQEKEPLHYRSDDCLWLFMAVPTYIKETGDIEFLLRVLPYADQGEDTVLGHLERAIQFNLQRTGVHGLPCGLHADWNDCLRLGERGESIFVAFQLRLALREFIELARRVGVFEKSIWAQQELQKLDELLERYAWDGEWYLRGYREDGFKFGSRDSEEGKIFMNPQVWAVISGHATGERARKAMEAMHQYLSTEYGIMLCAPPYIHTDPKIVLARLMNPGSKENAGIFNHTQGWAVMAAAQLGLNNRAWEYLYHVLPARFNPIAEIRQVEPYVVCQSTHSPYSPRFGNGRIPWLSGSAVWNYYVMGHVILGIEPDYDGLRIHPCIPSHWQGFTAQRRFRHAHFHISVERKNVSSPQLYLNHTLLPSDLIPINLMKDKNQVVVILPKE